MHWKGYSPEMVDTVISLPNGKSHSAPAAIWVMGIIGGTNQLQVSLSTSNLFPRMLEPTWEYSCQDLND